MLPILHFGSYEQKCPKWNFETSFNNNPFTSTWNSPDGNRSYNGSSSYLDPVIMSLFQSDITQEDTWSFRAIKSGDVNFSATINGQNFKATNTGVAKNLALKAKQHDCIPEGSLFTISVLLHGDDLLDVYQFALQTDVKAIELLGVKKGNVPHFSLDNFNLNHLNEGKLKTLWINLDGKEMKLNKKEGKQLFKIQVLARQEICDIRQVVDLEESQLKSTFLQYRDKGSLTSTSLTLSIDKKAETVNLLKRVFPNPSSSELIFEYKATKNSKVQIIVTDAFGQTIKHSTSHKEAGEYRHTFSNTSNLQAGALTYQVMIGKDTYTGTIVKIAN